MGGYPGYGLFLSTVLGQASDVFGRKFFMLLSPAMIFIARAGVLVYPSVRFCAAGIWFELRLELTGCTTTGQRQ